MNETGAIFVCGLIYLATRKMCHKERKKRSECLQTCLKKLFADFCLVQLFIFEQKICINYELFNDSRISNKQQIMNNDMVVFLSLLHVNKSVVVSLARARLSPKESLSKIHKVPRDFSLHENFFHHSCKRITPFDTIHSEIQSCAREKDAARWKFLAPVEVSFLQLQLRVKARRV